MNLANLIPTPYSSDYNYHPAANGQRLVGG